MPDRKDCISEERRQSNERPATERRKGGDRRDGAYRVFARMLPWEFANMPGTPRERVRNLVKRYCRGCDETLQADLAQALLPTLQAVVMLDGGRVSEEHKQECEDAVGRCVRKNELDTGRWDTACLELPLG